MRHQAVQVGMPVAIRDTETMVDADGNALPSGTLRVKRIYVRSGYKEPWIELDGVHGQFRAKDLVPDRFMR
jgi:hypothetical protein